MRTRLVILLAALAAGLAVVAPASAGPNLFFGFADDSIKYEPANAVKVAADLGAKAFRPTLLWHPGETEPNPSTAAILDSMTANRGGMRIVLSIYGQNYEAPRTDYARNQYCTYVKNTLVRWGLRDVAIWVEPNKQFFWKPQYETDGTDAAPRDYVLLLHACYDMLHAAMPDVNVIAPSTSPKGKDEPFARDNVAHSPGSFIRGMGAAYRQLGYTGRIFDTVGHHGYGTTSAERPWKQHGRTRTAEGDYDDLMSALRDAFEGTGQPIPGEGPEIWYLEMGFQTTVPVTKVAYYYGRENDHQTVVDDDGEPGWDAEPDPSSSSPAPDQATQIVDAVRLAYCQPYVGAIFNLQVWDEDDLGRWQSGVLYADRSRKASYGAFRSAIAEAAAHRVDCGALKGEGGSGGSAPRVTAGSCAVAAGVTVSIAAGPSALRYHAVLQRRRVRHRHVSWRRAGVRNGKVAAHATKRVSFRARARGVYRVRVSERGRNARKVAAFASTPFRCS